MEREEGGIGKEWKGRWKTMTDGKKDNSKNGWMDDGGKEDFGITLCSNGMNTNGLMLSLPTLHREKYLFCYLTPSEEVTHQFYK